MTKCSIKGNNTFSILYYTE